MGERKIMSIIFLFLCFYLHLNMFHCVNHSRHKSNNKYYKVKDDISVYMHTSSMIEYRCHIFSLEGVKDWSSGLQFTRSLSCNLLAMCLLVNYLTSKRLSFFSHGKIEIIEAYLLEQYEDSDNVHWLIHNKDSINIIH